MVSGLYDASYWGLQVPGGSTVVFEMIFSLVVQIDDPSTEDVEFDFSGGDSQVMCPLVAIGIPS